MNVVEVATIALLLLAIGFQVVLARAQVKITRESVAFLNSQLAEVIKTTLENLPETIKELAGSLEPAEPMNPIQMMIAQMLQDRMKPQAGHVEVISQEAGTGRFKKLDEF